jgi:hypothetical protein
MFDISALDILTPCEEGRDLVLQHPRSGRPWLDDAGQPITITLFGRWAGVAQQVAEAIDARRAARPIGAPVPTYDVKISEDAEYLSAVTRKWSFTQMDKKEFPCTPENARKLYGDPRFGFIRMQAQSFHRDDGNFLGEPTPPPLPGAKATSASIPPSTAAAPSATT